jgi:hypothetical protein
LQENQNIYWELNLKKNTHYVSIEIKHEKDAGCRKYCYFGEMSCCCHKLGFFTSACLHSQVAKKIHKFLALKLSQFHGWILNGWMDDKIKLLTNFY